MASMSDLRLMLKEEKSMLRNLRKIGYELNLQEEICDPYNTTVERMNSAGFNIFGK